MRPMTIDAIFRTNNSLKTDFNIQLTSAIRKLEHSLTTAFPDTTFFLIGHAEHLVLVDIITRTRGLSYKIQNGFRSCQLLVSKAQDADGSEPFLGTYALGMDKICDNERTVLLQAEPMSISFLEMFFM